MDILLDSGTSFLEDFMSVRDDIVGTKEKISKISENLSLAYSDDKDLARNIEKLLKSLEDVRTALDDIEIKVREYEVKIEVNEVEIKLEDDEPGRDSEELFDDPLATETDSIELNFENLDSCRRRPFEIGSIHDDNGNNAGLTELLEPCHSDPLIINTRKRQRKQKLSLESQTYQQSLTLVPPITLLYKDDQISVPHKNSTNEHENFKQKKSRTSSTIGPIKSKSALSIYSLSDFDKELRVSITRIAPEKLNFITNRVKKTNQLTRPSPSEKLYKCKSSEFDSDSLLEFSHHSSQLTLTPSINAQNDESSPVYRKTDSCGSDIESERHPDPDFPDNASDEDSSGSSNLDEDYDPFNDKDSKQKRKSPQYEKNSRTKSTVEKKLRNKNWATIFSKSAKREATTESLVKPRRIPAKKYECSKKCGQLFRKLNLNSHEAKCSGVLVLDPIGLEAKEDQKRLGKRKSSKPRKPISRLECPKKCGRILFQSKLSNHVESCSGLPYASNPIEKALYEGPPWVCPVCKIILTTRINLKIHTKTHTNEKPFNCPVCHKAFSEQRHVKTHLVIHSDERKYKCEKCSKTFKHRHSFSMHKKFFHSDNPGTHQCDEYGMLFKRRENLTRHYRNCHEKCRPYKCTKCDKSFKAKPHLNYHLKTHDNPNSKKRGLNRDKDVITPKVCRSAKQHQSRNETITSVQNQDPPVQNLAHNSNKILNPVVVEQCQPLQPQSDTTNLPELGNHSLSVQNQNPTWFLPIL